jgi:hypothetical protein
MKKITYPKQPYTEGVLHKLDRVIIIFFGHRSGRFVVDQNMRLQVGRRPLSCQDSTKQRKLRFK